MLHIDMNIYMNMDGLISLGLSFLEYDELCSRVLVQQPERDHSEHQLTPDRNLPEITHDVAQNYID